jgi:hypothetical protein
MNVEIGTEAPIFLFWEYLFQIFGILSLQCRVGELLLKVSYPLFLLLFLLLSPGAPVGVVDGSVLQERRKHEHEAHHQVDVNGLHERSSYKYLKFNFKYKNFCIERRKHEHEAHHQVDVNGLHGRSSLNI